MKRRQFIAGVAAISTAGAAGCLGDGAGTEDRDGTPTPSTAAADQIQTAAENFQTAISEFERYSGGLSESGLDYSTETVSLALEDGRESLEAARDANPNENQQAQIEYLATVANAIEATAEAYEHLTSMSDHLGLVDSYAGADRRDEAQSELENAQEALTSAEARLGDGVAEIEAARETDVSLDTDLALVEWRQRLTQTVETLEATQPALEGYGHELEGRWLYDDGVSRLEDEEYDEAADLFWDAYEAFDDARRDYTTAEEAASGSFKETLIRYVCQVEGLRAAAEHSQAAALEYKNGNYQTGNEALEKAKEDINRSC